MCSRRPSGPPDRCPGRCCHTSGSRLRRPSRVGYSVSAADAGSARLSISTRDRSRDNVFFIRIPPKFSSVLLRDLLFRIIAQAFPLFQRVPSFSRIFFRSSRSWHPLLRSAFGLDIIEGYFMEPGRHDYGLHGTPPFGGADRDRVRQGHHRQGVSRSAWYSPACLPAGTC